MAVVTALGYDRASAVSRDVGIMVGMMRKDISAGLFAPVQMLLVEDNPGSTLHRKLEHLISDIAARMENCGRQLRGSFR